MTYKKTILHLIDTLGRGGAETMLVAVTKRLPEYRNIVVTLKDINDFKTELECDKLFCLQVRTNFDLPLAIRRLRKIIRENNVDIVHSHLFWSNAIARLATPKNVFLLNTIHTFPADSFDYKPLRMRVVENLTFRFRKTAIACVAKGSLEQYIQLVKKQPYKSYVLYTFVDLSKFAKVKNNFSDAVKDNLKLVCVGNFKEQKNHQYLLNSFVQLKNTNITLDLFGAGELQNTLQQFIENNNLKINIKGKVNNINERLPEYDLMVMSSKYEGFALATLEAMALKVPLLLSDIASFREQCANTAEYFDINKPNSFVEKLLEINNNVLMLSKNVEAANHRVKELFTLDIHVRNLKEIYLDLTNNSM